MGVWRKWVFPILRLVIFSVIAIALVKVAFFPDLSTSVNASQPTGIVSDPVTQVAVGSIVTAVVIDAAVEADPAVDGRATLAGEIYEITAVAGQAVTAGDTLAKIRQEVVQEPVTRTDAAGNVTITQPRPTMKTALVKAPITGTVSTVSSLVGQVVAVGDSVAKVAPTTFSVSGPIKPEDQYRLVEQPNEAQVEALGGPGTFSCSALTISRPLAGAEASAPDGTAPATGAVVRCAVPADVRVFAGLTAKLTIAGGSADNILTLPVTAVKGNSTAGTVWVLAADGAPEERAVTLGLNDGALVQIVDGVAEGDDVLQFVPVDDSTDPAGGDGCIEQPDGTVFCNDEGYVG
ncbi:HlyD family efflux transporter periplasmic adaptor subunit [Mycetocola sp. 2940]|uniref:efflux RND transporter periplasmic adaptor subunit n=1 Tax=Mycetocola sp. 2940 TaxID=3156452 RepID=UPI003393228C